MSEKKEKNSQDDSDFGVLISQQDHSRYLALEENFKKSQTQLKQLTKKIFTLASKTIEIQEKNEMLKQKFKQKVLEHKITERQVKKQAQKLETQIKRLTDILTEKQTKIIELSNSIQNLKVDQKNQSESISKSKQELIILPYKKIENMSQTKYKMHHQNHCPKKINHFQILIKQLNFKLIGISKTLSEFNASLQPDKNVFSIDSVFEDEKKIEDTYQSIIMQEDSEIKMISEILTEIQNSIKSLVNIDSFYPKCKSCKSHSQQLSILESQNATLEKRLSKIEHESSTQLNMEVIRRKFSQISETSRDIYEIDQKLFNLKKSYQDCIEDQYQKVFAEVFKDQDQEKEVMQQVVITQNLSWF